MPVSQTVDCLDLASPQVGLTGQFSHLSLRHSKTEKMKKQYWILYSNYLLTVHLTLYYTSNTTTVIYYPSTPLTCPQVCPLHLYLLPSLPFPSALPCLSLAFNYPILQALKERVASNKQTEHWNSSWSNMDFQPRSELKFIKRPFSHYSLTPLCWQEPFSGGLPACVHSLSSTVPEGGASLL